ncbi:uncharacterized protein LOC111353487 [Spodoptera litura]|uniref:Uncharacterized protein LOC111353487 n=1 Tax=Spodoptera litura TaxID=69820 RepID=A0A9J7IT45_SPOLT|nr:uncharacterized protein LOC111353487 [Spodoptera litura]
MEDKNISNEIILNYELLKLTSVPSPATPKSSASHLSPNPTEPVSLCKCLLSPEPSKEEIISERKKMMFSAVFRTESYLRERRIPELIRFLLTKILARDPDSNVSTYLSNLLDDCMIFRAGLGVAPVLFEDRHLKAIVNSFDPSQRGWLTVGQVRRAFMTLGLTPDDNLLDRTPTDIVFQSLKEKQELELFNLLAAGMKPLRDNESEP